MADDKEFQYREDEWDSQDECNDLVRILEEHKSFKKCKFREYTEENYDWRPYWTDKLDTIEGRIEGLLDKKGTKRVEAVHDPAYKLNILREWGSISTRVKCDTDCVGRNGSFYAVKVGRLKVQIKNSS